MGELTLEQQRALAMASARQRMKTAQQTGPQLVYQTGDGGQVFRDGQGRLSYRDKAYATNDPAQIDRILQGATGGEVSVSSFDQQTIAQNPAAARVVKAVEGIPAIGSYIDEAVEAAGGSGAGVRMLSGAMEREKPGQSTALSLGGTLASAVPLAVAAAPVAVGSNLTRGAQAVRTAAAGLGLGAAEGAIYGYGENGNRAQNAHEGAVWGGLLGGVLGGAAPFAVDALKAGLSRLKGADTKVIGETLGIGPQAAVVVRNALRTNDLDAALNALQRGGDNAMLADAGVATQQLLDASANTSGRAAQITRDAMNDRTSVASQKFTETLDSVLGKPSGRNQMARDVREGTAEARDATYAAAYAKPIDYAGSGRQLESLLPRIPASAIRQANALMKANGEESAQILAQIGDDGSVTFTRLPDVRQWDYITRALNDVAQAEDGKGNLGGKTALGAAYSRLSTQIRQNLRRAIPEYGTALDTAADAISRVKAGDAGYSLLRPGTTREAIRDALQGASRAERDAMKEGVRTYIDDTLANVTETLTDPNTDAREAIKGLRDMSSRANREKLTQLLGAKRARVLFAELDEARVAFELRAALAANSKTNIRGNIQGAVRGVTESGALEILADGQPVEASRKIVRVFTGDSAEAKALREAGVFEDIATALTSIRGANAQRALRIVQKAIDGQPVNEAQAGYIANVLVGSAALTAHQQGKQLLSTR